MITTGHNHNTEHKQLQAPFHYREQNECTEFQMTLVMHISLLWRMWRYTLNSLHQQQV